MSEDGFAFEGLPLASVRPGTTVLVAGPTHAGARELGVRMLAGSPDEGAIVVTTNQGAARIVEDCRRAGVEVTRDTAAIIDCVGDGEIDVPARLLTVSGPSDLTGIGMRFSHVYRQLQREGVERIRTGLCSVSTLLAFSDLRTVSRFVHTVIGRIDGVGGLGVLLVDPANHDERAVRTLSQFCGGRIDVREGADGPELCASGLPDQPREWTPFDPLS